MIILNPKNREPEKKKKKNYNFHRYDFYVMFYYEIPWFYQDFKSENLCSSNLYSVHAARILNLSLEVILNPPK